MRHDGYYARTLAKRHFLLESGELSDPDVPGAKAAVLVPFMAALVQDRRDTERNFEQQSERVRAHFRARGQAADVFMRATVEDFRTVLRNREYASVALAGFGNISAIAVPFDRDKKSLRYGYIDWVHTAGMANHVKLGQLLMLQCCGFNREFNPPWGVGIMSDHRNIIGDVGQPRYTTFPLPENPVTDQNELTYREVRRTYQVERFPSRPVEAERGLARRTAGWLADIGIISDANWVRLRSVYNAYFNPAYPDIPPATKIPYEGEFDPRTFPQ